MGHLTGSVHSLCLCLSGWLAVQLAHLLPDLILLAGVLLCTALLMP